MSGGFFCDGRYPYYPVSQFADELENHVLMDRAEWSPEATALLKTQVAVLRRASKVMRAIDYLYSGDHSDDSFIRAMNEIEEER